MQYQRDYFLTEDEVRRLTGFCDRAKQRQFLVQQGIPCRSNSVGDTIVVRYHVEGRYGEAPTMAPTWQPRAIQASG